MYMLVKKLNVLSEMLSIDIDNEIGLIDLNDKSVLSDVQQRITRNFECSKQIVRAIWMLPFFVCKRSMHSDSNNKNKT